MTKSEFYDWKRHPVTEQIFSQLESRVSILVEELVDQTASTTQSEMAEKAGAIKAYRDILGIEYEEESHGS